MLIIEKAIAFAVTLAIALLLLSLVRELHAFQKRRRDERIQRKKTREALRRARNGKEMLIAAKVAGQQLCITRNGGQIGICKYSDFKKAYDKLVSLYEKNGGDSLTKRFVVHVRPTFTFWTKSEYATLSHTGGPDCVRKIESALLYVCTGYKESDVRPQDAGKAKWILFGDEGRLFVPFAGPARNIELTKAMGHERYTMDEAYDYLVNKATAAKAERD